MKRTTVCFLLSIFTLAGCNEKSDEPDPDIITYEDVNICQGQEYNGWSQAGEYRRTLLAANGKDSTVITRLSVYPAFKPTFSVMGDTLISDVQYVSYQWYDNKGAIAGENKRHLIIEDSGEYYLLATDQNGCAYPSDKKHVEVNKLPRSGEWKVNTTFGSFTFTVNPQGTHISSIAITFSDFPCGGVRQSGSMSSTSQTGWPINEKKFALSITINPFRNEKMTIEGQFNQKGNSASGTWREVVSGITCSGTWGPVDGP